MQTKGLVLKAVQERAVEVAVEKERADRKII